MAVVERWRKRVTPAKARVHVSSRAGVDPGFRRGDEPARTYPNALRVLLELRLERRPRHRTDHRVHHLPVLEEEDLRDRADVELHLRLLIVVDVELEDLCLALVLGG